MRRRRWPWIIAFALVAVVPWIIFWPRDDGYGLLRALHPKETYYLDKNMNYCHEFEFSCTYGETKTAVMKLGGKVQRDSAGYCQVILPSGTLAFLTRGQHSTTFIVVGERWAD